MKVKNKFDENDFDFSKYIQRILKNKFKILKIIISFFLLSVILSFLLPRKFNSDIIFTLINNQSSQSKISNLASIAGLDLDLNQNNNNLNPSLYYRIFDDIFFKREISKIRLNDTLTFSQYLIQENKKTLKYKLNNYLRFLIPPSYKNKFNEIENEYILTENEIFLFQLYNDIININIIEPEYSIQIITSLEDPNYASIVSRMIFKLLEKRIINLNIKYANAILLFNEKSFFEKEKEFNLAQSDLADFKDKNQIISSSKFNTELFILQNKFNLINNVFQEVSRQLELSKIQVKKDTPVFTILKEANVPYESAGISKKEFVFIISFIGVLISFSFYLIKDDISYFLKANN
tara:strand:- start:2338 stop:3384 length:1047 start_codon:yes stop_codon:yes gene_type:complete